MIQINYDTNKDFDALALPPSMHEIIFVKGTPHEMGFQYGQKAKDMIVRNFFVILAQALQHYTREQLEQRIADLVAEMESKTPEIKEWWEGIADGSGLTYGEVALLNLQLWFVNPGFQDTALCSCVAATKSATKDGKTIAGVNADVTFNMCGYSIIVFAFPDDGYPFVTIPSLAGQMGGNFVMNSEGLVICFDGGGVTDKNQWKIGYADFISAMVYTITHEKTAESARDRFESLGAGGGWIFLFADCEKNILIDEHTGYKNYTRYPGEHGEKDYIHAANHFISDKMKDHCSPEGWEDSRYRYDAEEELLQQHFGNLDLQKMMGILGCKKIFANGQWSEEQIWDPKASFYTPEMGAPDFRTGTRAFGLTEEGVCYVMHGTAYTVNSYMPGSTGKFAKIPVGKGRVLDVVNAMEQDAVMEVWGLSEKMYGVGDIPEPTMKLIDKAKSHLWIGKNYLAKAIVAMDTDEIKANENFGFAASQFAKAYITAQLV